MHNKNVLSRAEKILASNPPKHPISEGVNKTKTKKAKL